MANDITFQSRYGFTSGKLRNSLTTGGVLLQNSGIRFGMIGAWPEESGFWMRNYSFREIIYMKITAEGEITGLTQQGYVTIHIVYLNDDDTEDIQCPIEEVESKYVVDIYDAIYRGSSRGAEMRPKAINESADPYLFFNIQDIQFRNAHDQEYNKIVLSWSYKDDANNKIVDCSTTFENRD